MDSYGTYTRHLPFAFWQLPQFSFQIHSLSLSSNVIWAGFLLSSESDAPSVRVRLSLASMIRIGLADNLIQSSPGETQDIYWEK